jgi:hypothetical protein
VEPSMGVLSKMHTNQSWITKSLLQHLNPKPTLITNTLEPYGKKLLQHLYEMKLVWSWKQLKCTQQSATSRYLQ